jgi:hypothetical protein
VSTPHPCTSASIRTQCLSQVRESCRFTISNQPTSITSWWVWFSSGSAKLDEKKQVSWKERMDDWKSKQGILGTVDPDDLDADVPL